MLLFGEKIYMLYLAFTRDIIFVMHGAGERCAGPLLHNRFLGEIRENIIAIMIGI